MYVVDIKLKEILLKANLSERELARRTGIRQATINSMCNNEVKLVSLKNVAAICEVLDVDINDLLILHK
ncbi:helix-turn-helix transcriptional regulator [Paenibacillus sp. ISL-20]|uniref:helix-turn-helix domain-containing protein n=1 Tax=Paenibacillus sp. ISL-20 TaxID=2819163 RepID=UPI001BEB9DC5|nr:helix-turn-helix transcriptional regulator [Paenibacillus sp. ISL-20]MBT2759905.1 helix-turn-helix transcriptional regulator [Paenibacillus sp. ISL-20]